MKLARLALYLFGLGLLGSGLLFLAVPAAITALVEIPLPTPSDIMEARAVYGGLFIGTAVFLLLCARRKGWLRLGVIALAFISGGLVLGRTVGLLLGGPAVLSIYALLGSEIAVLAIALLALRQIDAGA